ncbi:hypothetical protein NIIDMKKI_05770 [Mycobacterium kansasii]|uniref:Uncharacterized protein n=1 Tax=Mycobacterium kansasii TaxID=1768 RepID=A0A7G1I2V3_MYCKA|nr:hypothetical protein NIIDMKKI_05770 [Mycobacterium kansasii]
MDLHGDAIDDLRGGRLAAHHGADHGFEIAPGVMISSVGAMRVLSLLLRTGPRAA